MKRRREVNQFDQEPQLPHPHKKRKVSLIKSKMLDRQYRNVPPPLQPATRTTNLSSRSSVRSSQLSPMSIHTPSTNTDRPRRTNKATKPRTATATAKRQKAQALQSHSAHSHGRALKIESHPVHAHKKVISLISDSDSDTSLGARSESTVSLSSSEVEQDEKGYLVFKKGLVLLDKFKLSKQLGKGTFSRVFQCSDRKNRSRTVAVKVIRNVYKYQVAAQTEIEVLRRIRQNDANDSSCCIHLLEHHEFRGHPLLVFPLLGRSVYSYMVHGGYKPFSLTDAIDLLEQVVRGVAFIHSLGIIMTDLKPENIVFVEEPMNPNQANANQSRRSNLVMRSGSGSGNHHKCNKLTSTRIKLIDFGSAVMHKKGATHKHLIQTRHYRAPEVILKLKWSFAADLWSIGCILVELVYGRMLFNTHCSIDHLNQIVKCIDAPPSSMLEEMDDKLWEEYFDKRGALNLHKSKRSHVQCKALQAYFPKAGSNEQCYQMHDLCTQLLRWEPDERIDAQSALQHPLFVQYHHNNNNNSSSSNKIKAKTQ